MNRELLTQIIEEVSKVQDSAELLKAKQEFQEHSGTIFEDDKSYESRIGSFLEWYIFDRQIPGDTRTPIQKYLEDHQAVLPPESLAICQALEKAIHSLFVLKKIKTQAVVVEDMFGDTKYSVMEPQGEILFNKNDIIEARLIPFQDKYYFTDNFCYHPQQTIGYIKGQIKALKKEERSALETLKTWNKDLAALRKKLAKVEHQIQKTQNKLDKTSSDNKKETLGKELAKLENDKAELETRIADLNDQIIDWEIQKIKIGLGQMRFRLIRKLSYMSLKWERSRKIDARDIYRD